MLMESKELKIGDRVQLMGTPLEFEVSGFVSINGQKLARSEKYGDFNIDLLEKLKTEFNEKD